jgi:outer membrane biosynthesis protein TonB
VSSRDEEREDLTNFTDSSLQFRESPIPQSTRRSPFSERRSTYSTAEHSRAESGDDIDLQRLEESVRRLQREAAVSRLRPPADEQPADHPGDARVQRRRADTYIDGYRVPPSLQPEVLTPPAELREGNGRLWTVLSMLIASAVAAPIAYYFAAGGSSSSTDQRLASAESRPTVETLTVTAPTIPARPPRTQERVDVAAVPEAPPPVTTVPRRSQAPAPQPPAAQAPAPQPPAPQPPAQRVERAAPPPVQTVERTPPAPQRTPPNVERPAPPQVAERAPQPATRTLDAAEVDVLVKQGQQFVAAGDFVTARLVFQRAAEAGNAAAALALGASYDPVVLSRLGVRGVDADVGKARAWYQKAKEFGAPDADRRLSTLANR